ncbi:hypothetical protein LXL04_004969 [Taraxacum kok-saghyz]
MTGGQELELDFQTLKDTDAKYWYCTNQLNGYNEKLEDSTKIDKTEDTEKRDGRCYVLLDFVGSRKGQRRSKSRRGQRRSLTWRLEQRREGRNASSDATQRRSVLPDFGRGECYLRRTIGSEDRNLGDEKAIAQRHTKRKKC